MLITAPYQNNIITPLDYSRDARRSLLCPRLFSDILQNCYVTRGTCRIGGYFISYPIHGEKRGEVRFLFPSRRVVPFSRSGRKNRVVAGLYRIVATFTPVDGNDFDVGRYNSSVVELAA